MNKVIASLTMAAFLTCPGLVLGGENPVSRQSTAGQAVIGAPARLSYREITLTLRDGTVVLGRLLGADTNSVRVLRDGPDLDVPYRDIQKAVMRVEGRPSRGVLPGITLGLWLGNGWLTGAFRRPGNYTERLSFDDEYAGLLILYLGFLESAFAAAGGGLGSVIASGDRLRAFEFPADPEASREARDKFLRFIAGEPAPARVHFLIQGGHVDPRVSRTFDAAIEEAGLTSQYSWTESSRFSLLRAFELSLSLRPRLRTGIRISFPGEPERGVYLGDEVGSWTRLTQGFKATAFHAVCSFEPLWRGPSDAPSWSVGLGIGGAAVRLRRASSTYRDGNYIENTVEARKTLPSAVAFTALEFRLSEIFSAGIAADYTFILSATVPGLPDIGIAARKAGLGNASVGFVLGYHF